MKAVVDHADGTRETFVTDGTWKVSKAGRVHHRHGHDPQRRLRRQGRALRRAQRAARLGHGRLRRLRLAARLRDRPAPAPAEPDPRDVQPPRPGDLAARLRDDPPEVDHQARRRQRRRRLRQGLLERPAAARANGVAGRALVMQTSYRLNNTTLARGRRRGRHDDQGRSASPTSWSATRSRSTRPPTASARAIPRRARSRRSARRGPRDGHHARRPAEPRARQRALRRGLARRHQHPRHAGLRTSAGGTREGRRPDRRRTSTGAGATCRSSRPARVRTLSADDIAAVVQHQSAPGGPPGDVRLRQPDAQRGLRADAALGDRLLAGDVPGHADA